MLGPARISALLVVVTLASCRPGQGPVPPPDLPFPCNDTSNPCGARKCGTARNSCELDVSCGSCAATETCSADGQCVANSGCTVDRLSVCATRACGDVDDGCGGTLSCGSCGMNAQCSATGQCVAREEDAGVVTTMDAGMEPVDSGVVETRDAAMGTPDAGIVTPMMGCPSARTSDDLTDDSDLHQVRALYVVASDSLDEELDTNGRICTSVKAFTGWLQSQIGATYRFDTHDGVLDIGFVRLNKTHAYMLGSNNGPGATTGYAYVVTRIERELQAMGIIKPNKLYTVYYGGQSLYACGGAAYPPTQIGHVVAMYLKTTLDGHPPCEQDPWGTSVETLHYYDWAMLHDLTHGIGIVPDAAPNEHLGGHTFDTASDMPNRDLMYSPRSGQSDPGWDIYNSAGLIVDINHDDYYAHSGSFVNLAKSAFLTPLPMNAVVPPGW